MIKLAFFQSEDMYNNWKEGLVSLNKIECAKTLQ